MNDSNQSDLVQRDPMDGLNNLRKWLRQGIGLRATAKPTAATVRRVAKSTCRNKYTLDELVAAWQWLYHDDLASDG